MEMDEDYRNVADSVRTFKKEREAKVRESKVPGS
jgi:hypothetical protein